MVRFLPHATKLRQGNVFTFICDSVHRGEGLCLGILCPKGVSVLCLGVLCPKGVSLQGGSLSRGLCPRGFSVQGSLSKGVLCPGVFCPGGLCPGGGLYQEDPPYGNMRAVRILLECILVSDCDCVVFYLQWWGCVGFSVKTHMVRL